MFTCGGKPEMVFIFLLVCLSVFVSNYHIRFFHLSNKDLRGFFFIFNFNPPPPGGVGEVNPLTELLNC